MQAWAIGVHYGREDYVWPSFLNQNIACIGDDPDEPEQFSQRMNSVKAGDLIVARSTAYYTTMRVRGIGICTQAAQINHLSGLGRCIGVHWLIANQPPNHERILCEFDFGTNDRITKIPHNIKNNIIEWIIENHANAYTEIQNQEIMQTLKILSQFRQIILSGPPGTSKTYEAKRLCAGLLGLYPQANNFNILKGERWDIIQFHPAYNYEDFVRGIQVSTNKIGQVEYHSVHRVFSEICRSATNNREKHVLIIDEINRANLASVLGELIYALEYRDEAVRTPYKINNNFNLTVPKNLYIIGTMNTADRSIGHIDYAVRRRFAFVPMVPDRKVIKQTVATHEDLQTSALQLYDAVASLFSGDKVQLTSDFFADDVQPGHTYFLAESCDELLTKFVYQVLPLLHEYVKDGVLDPDANLTIADLAIELKQPIRPMQIAKQLRSTLPCFQNQPQADVANGAE